MRLHPSAAVAVTIALSLFVAAVAPIATAQAVVPAQMIVVRPTVTGVPVILDESGQPIRIPDGAPGLGGLPPGVVAPPGQPGTNATPQGDPAEARLQALLQLRVDRRPEILLQSTAKTFAAAPASTNEVERVQALIATGAWQAFGEFLGSLPTNHSPRLYDHIVQQLLAPPGQVQGRPGGPPGMPAQPMQMPMMPMMPMQQIPGVPPPMNHVLPDDVLALAAICPAELTEERLQSLGQLLARALPADGSAAPVINRLEAGTPRLGGKDPAERRAAARLLIASGRLIDAGRFLPALDTNAVPRDYALLDVHASRLVAEGSASSQPGEAAAARRKQSLLDSWTVSQLLLSDTNCPARERESSLNRALDLLPRLGRELGSNWLRANFVDRPELGAAVLSQVGGNVARGVAERQAEPRTRALKQQKQVADTLIVSGAQPERWRPFLQVFAAGWIREADFTRSRPSMPQNFMPQQFDPYGNPIYFGPQQRFQDPNQPQPVEPADLLDTAPGEAWLALLDVPSASRVAVLSAQMQIRASRFDDALTAFEGIAKADATLARNLAHDLLNAWAETRQPQRQNPYGPRYYYPPYMQQSDGIPLTRAHQQRNLDELAAFLPRLRRLPVEALDDSTVVSAFTRAHSQAEVFRVEDITRVFGPFDLLRSETLSELLQAMRSRLAGQWRQPRVQQDAKTKRNDKEIAAEARRGYELVTKLADQSLAARPADWRLKQARAAVLYDWAEFDYGQKVDLAVYTARRDEAFRVFEEAAGLYAKEVPALDEAQQSPRVFQQWFNATLGASDLSYLTRQTEPGTNQLARIRNAMLALPADAAERHLAAFSRDLSGSANGLKPELKPRYLRAGLEITRTHEAARNARELLRHYDDLLREIVLDVRVDGETTVGHGRPFGVFVGILHTDSVGRESGGFARYLQNQGNTGYYYNPYGGGPVNYRDEFEKQVREKYSDGFEVLAVTFHDDKVEPRGTDRPGWRLFPYAYLLLKAKDASVDKLPPLQINMDFMDARGPVSLAVASAPVLVDARPEDPPLRPATRIDVVQTLDDRDLAKGAATLEIKATARGLVPNLDRLFDVAVPGFRIGKVEDRGLSLSQMDTEGDALAPVSERVWLLPLQRDPGGDARTFVFPKSRVGDIKLAFKRYADADLVDVEGDVALAGLPLQRGPRWPWALGAVVAIGALTPGLLAWRKRRRATGPMPATPAYGVPEEISPFSVIHLLERLAVDGRVEFTEEQRRELAAAQADLQRRYFDRPDSGNHEPDLRAIAERWVAVASKEG